MKIINVSLPAKIYRYSSRQHLERSLNLGEFRLCPASDYTVQEGGSIPGTGAPRSYLLVCFSDYFSDALFDEFHGADACLAITNVHSFSERIHAAVEAALPDWHGIEARVSYGKHNQPGPVFSKPLTFQHQREFRFVWQPGKPVGQIAPVKVTLGSIADIAEIIDRPNDQSSAPLA